ncbi:hypothetical protein MMC31_005145 [Peltigera leucophlebia]|nr:hypothetical protein [Peltigera leucophlebia]
MDSSLEKQLKSTDHPLFKERPKGVEPVYSKRRQAMGSVYEETEEEVEVEAWRKRIQIGPPLSEVETGRSRTSTMDSEARDLSRSSTLADDETVDQPHFKERPRVPGPFFATRLRARDPNYQQTRREVDIEVPAREISRAPTGLSRALTANSEEMNLSRSSTLAEDESADLKEKPQIPEPFFAKRLKAMDPDYEKTRREVDIEVQVREISRAPTGLSRASTLNEEEREISRSSTLAVDDDDEIVSLKSMLRINERMLSRASTFKIESPEIVKKAQRGRRTLTWAIVSQIISLLWLAPILALLILNYRKYIIGASIWCPGGHCSAELFSPRAIAKAAQLDMQDHNAIGALQFVSKALEVWFVFIATSLVYDMAMVLAKGGGLPIAFLLTHLEFADIRYLVNPLLWTSPIPHPSTTPRARSLVTGKLYLFVLLAASLTVLTNLMGPAAAVLAIPTLQWIETPRIREVMFNGTNADYSPGGELTAANCTEAQLEWGNYSCTEPLLGPSLDSYAQYTRAASKQWELPFSTNLIPISQEGSTQFTVNISDGSDLIWSPSRYALRDLSIDIDIVANAFLGNPTEEGSEPPQNFNNSLSTILQRESISFGISTRCYFGTVSDMIIDEWRWVSCYGGWYFPGGQASNYTMCIRRNIWSEDAEDQTYETHFSLEHANASSDDPLIQIWVYYSDRVTYFNETTDFGTGIKDCLASNIHLCDWDKIFDAPLPPKFHNATQNVNLVEYRAPVAPWSRERTWCDWYTYGSYPTYSYDISAQANPLSLVQLNNISPIEKLGKPVLVHPTWLLAAWSVDTGGTVPWDRQITKAFTETLSAGYSDMTLMFSYLHTYTLCQAVSIIDYNTCDPYDATDVKLCSGPIMSRYATLHLWAYGLSDKTSQLGVVVAILGITCVLIRLILGVIFRFRHEHSALELFVAAMKHQSRGEFDGLEDELELAKVRFKMCEDEESGKPRFWGEPRRGVGWEEGERRFKELGWKEKEERLSEKKGWLKTKRAPKEEW